MPGQRWSDAIIEGIEQSRALLVILSAAANLSVDVAREVERAAENKKIILCIRVEDIRPSGGLSYFLSPVQWIDVFPGPLVARLDWLARSVVGAVDGSGRAVEAPPPEPKFVEVDPDDFNPPIWRRRSLVSRRFKDR